MHINALGAVFRPPYSHCIPAADIAQLGYTQLAGAKHGRTVHTAVLRKMPFSMDAEIFRKHRSGMVACGRHAVLPCFYKLCIRRIC